MSPKLKLIVPTILCLATTVGCAHGAAAASPEPTVAGPTTEESDTASGGGDYADRVVFGAKFHPKPGSPRAYFSSQYDLPEPAVVMTYTQLPAWRKNAAQARQQLEGWLTRGIPTKEGEKPYVMLLTITLPYREQAASMARKGTIPYLEDAILSGRFDNEIEAIRSTLEKYKDSKYIDGYLLRFFQEAGHGFHSEGVKSPERYAKAFRYMAERFADLDPQYIFHWNAMRDIEQAYPGDDVVDYFGWTVNMPTRLERFGTVFEELHEKYGKKSWLAETSIHSGRKDRVTGYRATGLTNKDVWKGFFEPLFDLIGKGHVGGITWINDSVSMRGGPEQDTAWERGTVDPEIRRRWIAELDKPLYVLADEAGAWFEATTKR